MDRPLLGVISNGFQVIVTADRGLYADWLYQLIVDAGWHPFLRVNHQGTYRTSLVSDRIAVSTLWMVMLGGEAENQLSPPNLETLPPRHIVFSQPLNLHSQRHICCFLQGLLTLIANLLNHVPIQLHRSSFFPFYSC
ncbi:hypothetical protein [Nostoc linckia]|uniref:hypothetical protein n=1 Tax=Nostoc linckia TaxID=92942 RepID=UPI001C55921E|nr:hypothetical protein [Nostoc linckia]